MRPASQNRDMGHPHPASLPPYTRVGPETMTTYSLEEAKEKLGELIDCCYGDRKVFIERDDRRTVELTRVHSRPRFTGVTSLPFFAYGVFKPGQLAFHRLRNLVQSIDEKREIKGCLRIRDGMPILDENGPGNASGSVITFLPDRAQDAYQRIADLEPENQ